MDEDQARRNYQTWMTLIERQGNSGWILNQFHPSAVVYQLMTYHTQVPFEDPENRLSAAGFRQFLLACPEEDFPSMAPGGDPHLPGNGEEHCRQPQDLLRRLASSSALQTLEIGLVRNDPLAAIGQISDLWEKDRINWPALPAVQIMREGITSRN